MITNSALRAAVVATSATVVMGVLAVPGADAGFAAQVHYVSPTGTGMECGKTTPCSIEQAFSEQSAPAEIIIEPGSYGSTDDPISQVLTDGGQTFNIHSVAGAARPVIYSSATIGIATSASTLYDVTVVSTGVAALEPFGGTVTRMTAINTAPNGIGCAVAATLSDSLCIATGNNAKAVDADDTVSYPAGTMTYTLRNVTAEATSPSGTGLFDYASTSATPGANLTLVVKATNVIIHGGLTDIAVKTGSAASTAKVILRHSDYATTDSSGTVGSRIVDTNSTDISAPPGFVNALHGDYRETATSPTVNKGTATPAGDKDLADHPRDVGSAPDIGAYERLAKPGAHALKVTKKGRHSLVGKVTVNGKGLATKVKIVATHNGHLVEAAKQPHAITHRSRVRFVLRSLKPHTHYRLHAVVTSIGGHAKSATRKATTHR